MNVFSWFRRTLSSSKSNSPSSSSSAAAARNGVFKDEEVKLYGITDQLIEFVKSLSLDTFKNFSLPDEEAGSNADASDGTSANVRQDLSEWQEQHAMLILSRVKYHSSSTPPGIVTVKIQVMPTLFEGTRILENIL